MAQEKQRMPGFKCPACGGGAVARTVGKASLTYRELYYHCRDELGCGHVFVVSMEAQRTVRASSGGVPIHPLPHTAWRRPPANDDAPDLSSIKA